MQAQATQSGVAKRTRELKLVADSAVDELFLGALYKIMEEKFGQVVVTGEESKFTWKPETLKQT